MQDSIQDSTRYVVSDIHYGNIMPGNRMEMMRDVFIVDNAKIEGGVYSNNLTIEGSNISILKSVYARKSISIREKNNGSIDKLNEFSSTVVAADSILSEITNTRLRFKSDIYTKKLNVSNAIVYGNIFADQAIIRNSIVLGGIFIKNKLDISNSMFSTFRVKEVILGKNLYMFFPVALSETALDIKYPINALSFFNVSNKIEKKVNSGIVQLDNDDVFEVEENQQGGKEIEQADGEEEVVPDQGKFFCLSMAERVLDADSVIENFKINKDFLESLTLGSHYTKSDKPIQFDKPIEELERWLWDILNSGGNLDNLTGTTDIRNLFERIVKNNQN